MPETLHPSILTVGLFDQHFYQACGPSLTAHQQLPITFEYAFGVSDPAEVDVVVATTHSAAPGHPRRCLWLQENREHMPHTGIFGDYDYVLTNDADLIAVCDNALYVSPIGTWLDLRTPAQPKTAMVSMIASAKLATSGHRMRYAVAQSLTGGFDGYGLLYGRPIAAKDEALRPYRYSIVIEAASYNWYMTEKLWDCFAARTLPIYWGSPDLAPLGAMGFDVSGILPWSTLDELRAILVDIAKDGERFYDSMALAIQHNFTVARRLYCAEVMLESVLRDAFDLR